MQGSGAPAIELNRASLQHVHKLLQQLLKDANVPHVSKWEHSLIPILLRATDDVDPDVQGGDDMDIRSYVKLKKVPGGKPSDTAYISGLVFTKNVALKSMPRSIANPRILIITFPLEYTRSEQHFMSLDPVIRQEREFLENLIGRIAALKPHILLAQRNVSGLALELLTEANIATAFNVKPSVLEAVSRCTQAKIITSMDKLTSQPAELGSCENFEVRTFVSAGRKKTYIYLSGCPPALGCTIIIRGGDPPILTRIKRITEFMVYVVYSLKLETCLMRDEWGLIPSTAPDTTSTMSEEMSKSHSSTASKPHDSLELCRQKLEQGTQEGAQNNGDHPSSGLQKNNETPLVSSFERTESSDIPEDVPVPSFYKDLVEKHQTRILSASPFVKFMQPYLLMRARELERRVVYLKRLRDQDVSVEQTPEEKAKAQKFTLIQPDMLHASLAGTGKKVREILKAVHDSEYDKVLHTYETQKKQWVAYLSGNRNLFDPYAHQNIVVLFSQVSTTTSIPCSGPDLLAFSFYNEHESDQEFEPDCTLGQYVEDLCYRANDPCLSNACEKKMCEHHRQYVHGEGQVSVFVLPFPAKMRGMQNTILMWSQCKVCGVETPVTPMSSSTWKYSFGKYLELSFWSADVHARASICPHDLHRDHLRYFGYKDFALRIHYDAIELLDIVVPRLRITWKVDNVLRFRNEVYTRIEHRLTRFMVSIISRLKSINVDAVSPEYVEACRAEIEVLMKRANEEHSLLVKQLQERYNNSRHWETIPFNRALRAAQLKVEEWDNLFADFERKYLPSEKDITRLAALQLKKIVFDSDVSVTSVTATDDGVKAPPVEGTVDEQSGKLDTELRPAHGRRSTVLSPEKTQSVLQSVLAENSKTKVGQNGSGRRHSEALPSDPQLATRQSQKAESVQHLDLNLMSSAPEPEGSRATSMLSIGNVPSEAVSFDRSPTTTPETSPVTMRHPEANTTHPEDRTVRSATLYVPGPSETETLHQVYERSRSRRSSPALLRARSNPAVSSAASHGEPTANQHFGTGKPTALSINATSGSGSHLKPGASHLEKAAETNEKAVDKTLSERLGLSNLKSSKFGKGHSLIPRAIIKKGSRVSNLAKHFEQLSKEFEKERIRERKLQAAKHRQSRVYPLASSNPIVEVYKNVDEAVQERDSSEGIFYRGKPEVEETGGPVQTLEGMVQTNPADAPGEGFHRESTPGAVEDREAETETLATSRAVSEAEDGDDESDSDEASDEICLPQSPADLLRMSQEEIDLKVLPKHETTSLLKILTNFWAERSSSGWTALEYPLRASDHVFADCDIIVREDEPSSIIAFALDSQDYKTMLEEIQGHDESGTQQSEAEAIRVQSSDTQTDLLHSLLRKTGTHLKYQFQEGPAKMLCKIFFAEQFDAMRRKCGVSEQIVESLSRCMKWDSKGGKTKSLFLKTLDDRFVLKSLSPTETQSFLKFAPNYFQIMSEAFFHELPSVIAKMLGFYQIIIKNPVTGVEYNWFLLVMENLFYDRAPTRIFDLKGSMRNRKIQSTGERNEVLLDENMVEFIYESPLFAREHSKKLLRSSVHNDTLFLARQNVMDYSLMLAIDEKRKELVVGIIDCIRTYTWDKKLESWIKDRGFAGGGKNRPTVTSPKEYKKRFREAMGRYVLEAPNCWHQFKPSTAPKRMTPIQAAVEETEPDKGDLDLEGLT